MPDLNVNVVRINRTFKKDPLVQFLCFFCHRKKGFRTGVKYEPAQSDEPRTVAFEIVKEATREENAQDILELIKKESVIH